MQWLSVFFVTRKFCRAYIDTDHILVKGQGVIYGNVSNDEWQDICNNDHGSSGCRSGWSSSHRMVM